MRSELARRGSLGHAAAENALLAVLLTLAVGLVMAPGLNAELPGRDAGVFLYAGSRIAEGEIPYVDFWDHKGPLIYYVNAIGVALTPGSQHGVWVLEFLALSAFGFGLYRLLRMTFGTPPAILAVSAAFAGIGYLLAPGNYTEEFALPFQVAGLLLLAGADEHRAQGRRWFLLGLSGAAAFLLRPDNATLHVAIGIYLIQAATRGGTGFGPVGRTGVGVVAGLLPVGLYFTAEGALGPMLDAVVRYNAVYVQASLQARLEAVLEGFRVLAPTGLPLLALAGWLPALRVLHLVDSSARRRRVLAVAALTFPVQVLIVVLAGRSLDHYYLNWIPSMAVLAAFALSRFLDPTPAGTQPESSRRARRTEWIVGLAVGLLLLPARRLVPTAIDVTRHGPGLPSLHTEELRELGADRLLMWGAESSYNFLTGIPAPTRFVYQYPLYACGYVTDEMAERFANDIKQTRPLIVDSSPSNPAVPPLDADRLADWSARSTSCALTKAMLDLINFVDSEYELVGHTTYAGWPIYRVND